MCVESGGDCSNSTMVEAEDDGFSQNPSFSIEEEKEEHRYHHQNSPEQAAMDMELIQQQLNLDEQCYNTHNDGNNGYFIQELGDLGFPQYYQSDLQTSLPLTPDLLGMFSLLPSSSLLPFTNNTYPESSSFLSSSLGLSGDLPTGDAMTSLSPPPSSTLVGDPSMFTLSSSLSPRAPLLFHSLLPHGFGGSSRGSLFDEKDQVLENNVAFYQDVSGGRGFGNGVFEFTSEINGLAKKSGKDPKHFALEKQRRVHFNDKFQALRKLIPNPSKNDRASILGDAIEYINELKSTATKLKVLVEKKRSRERIKRQKTAGTDGSVIDVVKSEVSPTLSRSSSSSSSSSWHGRKSKNTEVNVRIVDDEVTVKLAQHKGTNCLECLLLVSKVLDELHLDLYHVAGGLFGDYYRFLFNSKIFQGTTVYASAIANMLVEAAEKHYTTAAIAPTS